MSLWYACCTLYHDHFATYTHPQTKLDGKHVVFGKVTSDIDVLRKISAFAGDKDGLPTSQLRVTACGVVA